MKLRRASLCFALLWLAAACTTPDPTPDPTPQAALPNLPTPPDKPDGHQRLSTEVAVPRSYHLALTIDPRADRFTGQVEVQLDLLRPTTFVQLHAGDLDVTSATLIPPANASAYLTAPGEVPVPNLSGMGHAPLTIQRGDNGGLLLSSERPLSAGPRTVSIAFSGPLGEVPDSLYRVQEQGRWYAYTQFEPLAARDAFPCFDDPGFKTPFTLSITAPNGMLAVANYPETQRNTQGDQTTYTFAPTRPMPTYLVAFAVGEFDVVEAPADAIPNVPLRVIAPKDKGKLARYALQRTPGILQALTDYFGAFYPYPKLDLVAVPNFSAGAMENVGLVTFRERLLLVDGDQAPAEDRRSILGVIAHELAHMWFGDLVTMQWWDDLWLNEAFATWMGSKVVARVEPDLEEPLAAVQSKGWVVNLDAQAAARAVRQPIRDGGDVHNAFDGITYTKGAAVLRMLETWTGEEPFKQGVRDYLNAHADGNATTADLFSALDKATQKPLGQTAATFVDQPGTPLVDVTLDCSGPKPQVALTQSRYLPAGSQAAQTGPWRVPVCLRYEEADGAQGRTCVMLDAPSQRLDLDAKTCPKWLHPNADEQGYYLWRLPTDQMLALVRTHRAKLSLAERVALPQHLGSLLRAETLPADAYLSALEELAKDDHWMVIQGVVNGLGPLGYTAKRTPDLRAPYAAYVRRVLGPHLKRLGLDARPNEPVEAQLLRPSLISVMVHQGDDPKVKAHVRKQAEAFLKGDPKIPVEVGRSALSLAALDGDEALWLKLKDAFPKAQTPAMRGALLGGLGNFSDPKLVERSLGLLLDGTLRSQDFWAIVGPPMRNEELHALVWAWGTSRYDELVKFLGPKSAPGLPNLSSGFCSTEGRAKTEEFFSDPKRAPEGTQRNLALALERIGYCVRMQTTHAPTLKAFLGKKK